MTNRFVAKFDHTYEGVRHYKIFCDGAVNIWGERYSVGYLRVDADGTARTYCGTNKYTGFHYVDTETFPSAEQALADFRAKYEAAEARWHTVVAHALELARPFANPVVPLRASIEDLTVEIELYGTEIQLPIRFQCSPAEAIALLECPETNVSVTGYWWTKEDGGRRWAWTQWRIPAFSDNYEIENICRSTTGRGKAHREALNRVAV